MFFLFFLKKIISFIWKKLFYDSITIYNLSASIQQLVKQKGPSEYIIKTMFSLMRICYNF